MFFLIHASVFLKRVSNYTFSFTSVYIPWVNRVCVNFQAFVARQLGPSALAVPEQLSNGGGKNVGHSPAESGTDFWALCTTSATLWPL